MVMNMSETSGSLKQSKCPSCQVVLNSDAKFCHACGVSVEGSGQAKNTRWKTTALVAAMAVAVGGSVLLLGNFVTQRENVSPSSTNSAAGNFPKQTDQPVDLSTMSPREAADRLFNRVMASDESGDVAQAIQFAPMALEAYRLANPIDADAQYHVGLISLVLGNFEDVQKQIDGLKQFSANHLLAMALEFKMAKRIGDEKSASAILPLFSAAYETELGKGRPEYEAHRVTIDKLRASSSVNLAQKAPAQAALSGAGLFKSNCMRCHGVNGAGSDIGPPLINKIYEPSHHADGAFFRAVRLGVKSHHWPFGDMPPVPSVTDEQVTQIVQYIRKLQVENGIY